MSCSIDVYIDRTRIWDMPHLVKWKKFMLCSHIGSNTPCHIIWTPPTNMNRHPKLHSAFSNLYLFCTLIMLKEMPSILLLLAFLLVQPCIHKLSQSSNNFTDQSALSAFKSKITFAPNNTVFVVGNWSNTTNFCEWFGVSCSRHRQRVITLNLSSYIPWSPWHHFPSYCQSLLLAITWFV